MVNHVKGQVVAADTPVQVGWRDKVQIRAAQVTGQLAGVLEMGIDPDIDRLKGRCQQLAGGFTEHHWPVRQ